MDKVKISLEKYEELLGLETRVNVVVDQIINKKYISAEDILRILGTEEALVEAARLRKEDERREKERSEKYGFTVEENADM